MARGVLVSATCIVGSGPYKVASRGIDRVDRRTRTIAVCLAFLISGILAGCTRAELESKAEAYNAAIGESNNRQILLNAVRASQRAPMSFVGYGDVAATPTFSGSAAGTFNFDPFGLTTYTLNPTVNVGGGFSNL